MTEPGNGNGAAISPRGRFERMEKLLSVISDKLDTKASMELLRELTKRVDLLERIDSNRVAAAEALKLEKDQTADMLKQVSDLRYRTLAWFVGIATMLSIAVSIGSAIGNFVK